MRGALIHGVLLVVMLVYGYRTWTRDKTVKPDLGSVVLWDRNEADLSAIEIRTEKTINKLEHRGQGKDAYWWGLEYAIDKKSKAPAPAKPGEGSGSSAGSAAGSGAGSAAGSGAGSSAGSGAPAAPAVADEEVIRKNMEYPLGEAAEKVIKGFSEARALRDLGVPTDEQKKDYKLSDSKMVLKVTFKDGERSFLVGGSVYGGSDRYIADQKTNRAYILSKDIISPLEIGESSLHLLDPRGFEMSKAESVTIEAGGKSKTTARVQTGVEGQQVKTWGDPDTKKADQTIANFVDNTNNLRPTEYRPELKVADLTPIMKLTYKDSAGGVLGTMGLYKREKPGDLATGADLDPANPPKGETEYLIITEKTRVPAVVRRDSAQRTEGDIPTVFGDHPTNPTEPKGNPLGDAPLPPTSSPHGGHGATPPPPGGALPGAAPGGAAPTPPAGSPPATPPAGAPPAGGGSAAKADAPKTDAKKAPAKSDKGW